MTTKQQKISWKKELLQWGAILAVFGLLYFTSLGREVSSGMQSLLLKTGMIKPDVATGQVLGETNYQFSLTDLRGNQMAFSSLKGQVIFLNVWATWCPPCRAEMPDIHDLYLALGENVAFVMLSVDDDAAKAEKYITDKGFDFPVYFAKQGLPQEFYSKSIPTTYVINQQGEIVMKKTGMASYNTPEFKDFLLKLAN